MMHFLCGPHSLYEKVRQNVRQMRHTENDVFSARIWSGKNI